jgi:CubicO group peptidase (beta-lactamase class C family)
MRRVITLLTAVGVVCLSVGLGVITADLPFWRRALELPLAPGEHFPPSALLGSPHDAAESTLTIATTSAAPLPGFIDPAALERAATLARQAGVAALLVQQGGRLQFERYFGDAQASAPVAAHFMSRLLTALTVGAVVRDGRIASLDAPVARYLPEWSDDARGAITLRQLLQETSGLETGAEAATLLGASPFDDLARLPAFATSKGVRMLLGNDFESTALRFRLAHEPGAFFNPSPANAQLVAVILERITGLGFERLVDERIWQKVGGGEAQLPLDRRSGMPTAHCCLRATPRDLMRIAALLIDDAQRVEALRVLPANWSETMRAGSRANQDVGMQLQRLARADGSNADPLWRVSDGANSLWIAPESQLAILSIAGAAMPAAPDDLPAVIRAGLLHQENAAP